MLGRFATIMKRKLMLKYELQYFFVTGISMEKDTTFIYLCFKIGN